MNVYFDESRHAQLHDTGARNHRWIKGAKDEAIQYYNFLEQPELIREVLEDFRPYDRYAAIQTFYGLIEWLNGPESLLETNDCGFRLQESKTEFMPNKREAEGRLMVFLRDYMLNLQKQNADFMMNHLGNQLQTRDVDFVPGCIGFAYCPTLFNSLPEPYDKAPSGVLTVYFWAWGDTDDEAFANLDRVFKNLTTAFKATNDILRSAFNK